MRVPSSRACVVPRRLNKPRCQLGGGNTISSREELADAAAKFSVHYRATCGHASAENGTGALKAVSVHRQLLAGLLPGKAVAARPAALVVAANGSVREERAGLPDVVKHTVAVDVESTSPVSGSSGGRAGPGLPDKRRRPSWWTTFR
jgi:hypothetical protein